MAELHCHQCAKSVPLPPGQNIGRSESCPHCRADLRVCLNCQHYDPAAYRECREEISEGVREKARANFCDSFQARLGPKNSTGVVNTRGALFQNADALFKKK